MIAGVVFSDKYWTENLQNLKDFRRHLRKKYNILISTELHATEIWNNRGDFRKINLTMAQRKRLFSEILLFARKLKDMKIIVVSADKSSARLNNQNIKDLSWKYLFQRFENLLNERKDFGQIYTDFGHESDQRRILRRMRIYNPIPSKFTGFVRKEIKWVIEDPNIRDSKQSYFIQLVDICAYICRLRNDITKNHKFWKLHKFYKILRPVLLKEASGFDKEGFVYIK